MNLSIILLVTFSVSCFSKSLDKNSKIVGGNFAEKNQFPHQVAIIYRGQLRCGGSIVASQWILTAAHCVVDGIGTLVLKLLVNFLSLNSIFLSELKVYQSLLAPTHSAIQMVSRLMS